MSQLNTILYQLFIEVLALHQIPEIIYNNSQVLMEIIDVMRTSVDDNILFSFMSRVLDLWERKKTKSSQLGEIVSLCFEQGMMMQKITALKLLNRDLSSNEVREDELPLERISELILSCKQTREREFEVDFHNQAFEFLGRAVAVKPSLIASKGFSEKIASLIATIDSIIQPEVIGSIQAGVSGLSLIREALAIDDFRYDLLTISRLEETTQLFDIVLKVASISANQLKKDSQAPRILVKLLSCLNQQYRSLTENP